MSVDAIAVDLDRRLPHLIGYRLHSLPCEFTSRGSHTSPVAVALSTGWYALSTTRIRLSVDREIPSDRYRF